MESQARVRHESGVALTLPAALQKRSALVITSKPLTLDPCCFRPPLAQLHLHETKPMKFAIWAYTATVALTAFLVATLSGLFQNIFHRAWGDRPLPALTDFFIHLEWWVMLAALPFLIAACWLTIRSSPTADRALVFAGAATFVSVFLFAFALVAVGLPFVAIYTTI